MDRRKIHFGGSTYFAYSVTFRILSDYNFNVEKLSNLLREKKGDYYFGNSINVTRDPSDSDGYFIRFGCDGEVETRTKELVRCLEEIELGLAKVQEMRKLEGLLNEPTL